MAHFITGVCAGFVALVVMLVNMTISLLMWAFALTFAAWLFPETFKAWLVLFHADGMAPWQIGIGFGLLSWLVRSGK